jgi:DNA-binding transcriptional MerR regulator
MSSDGAPEWTIGELARAATVTVRTLRHYDQLGLLKPSSRSMGNRRRYGVSNVHRLYRILSLRSLGFPLAAISKLLDPEGGERLLYLTQRQSRAPKVSRTPARRSSKPFAVRCEASWVGSIPIHLRHFSSR